MRRILPTLLALAIPGLIFSGPLAPAAGATTLPSRSAKMICATEAQREIATSLGVTATVVTAPTWVEHLYSCTYMYPDGAISLSVKELPTTKATTTYFRTLAKQLGRQRKDVPIGQDAFATSNGSVVLRKDHDVLTVDISQLPARFGTPPASRANVALNTAATIMGCW